MGSQEMKKLCAFVYTADSTDQTKKGQNFGKDPQLDKVVFKWFVKERHAGTPISGPVWSIQVQILQNVLHIDNPNDFDVSKGWLHCFQCCAKQLKTTSYRFLQKGNT